MLASEMGTAGTFLFYSVFVLLGGLFVAGLCPETKGTVRVFCQTFTLEDAIGTHACSLKLLQACDHWHSSRVSTPPTSSQCKLHRNTEGLGLEEIDQLFTPGRLIRRFVVAIVSVLQRSGLLRIWFRSVSRWFKRT